MSTNKNRIIPSNDKTYWEDITQNQPMSVKELKEWEHGLYGCCDDMTECCFAFWLLPCHMCRTFSRANESCFSCIFGGLVPLRTRIRIQRRIKGSIPGDFIATYCCMFCTLVQLANEIKG